MADDRPERDRGATGERGQGGDRGVTGERGPKGDHGQHGETGRRGSTGATGAAGSPGGPGWFSQEAYRALGKVTVGVVIVVVALSVAVWYTGYSGRVTMVENQREGCKRGKLDRAANARAWRAAEGARLNTAGNPEEPASVRRSAADTARIYATVAASLEARARIVCRDAFPDPPPLEFR
jgi:hypothetical protein